MASDSIPSNNMTKVGDDLVLEILIRLPCYKIAMRCRSVCKQWLTIISHHTFRKRFLHHHGNKSKGSMLISCKRKRIEKRDEDEIECVVKKGNKHHHHQVLLLAGADYKEVLWYMDGPCCNGPGLSMTRFPMFEGASLCVVAAWNDLILCMSRGSGPNKYKVCPNEPYFLYNLFTKQGIWLPHPSPSDIKHCCTIGLVCEPDKAEQGSSYRYWVVFFESGDATTRELEVRMFSSSTGKWSRFFLSSPEPMRERGYHSTFVVGRKIYTYSLTTGILGFDPCTADGITNRRGTDGKEKHVIEGHFIGWPCGMINRPRLATDVALKSCSDNKRLLLSQLDFNFKTACLRVWSLEDHNNGYWLLKHNMSLQLLDNYELCFTSTCCGYAHMYLIGFNQTEGDGDVVYLMAEKRIVMCNLKQGNMQLVGRIPDNVCPRKWYWTTLPLWPTPPLEPTKLA